MIDFGQIKLAREPVLQRKREVLSSGVERSIKLLVVFFFLYRYVYEQGKEEGENFLAVVIIFMRKL